MTDIKMSSRDRILKAAGQVAREVGPGHLSLDAVAQQAGVSKGGLLYNFPSKAKLLEALVEQHLADFSAALNEKEKHQAAGLGAAYLELFITELKQRQPPPSGVLAALAENPDFLAPVRRFNRDLLDRMKASSENEGAILVFFLALEGMRALRLFGVDILSPEEQDVANASLTEILLHSQRLA